jgi:hypothetical protein
MKRIFFSPDSSGNPPAFFLGRLQRIAGIAP